MMYSLFAAAAAAAAVASASSSVSSCSPSPYTTAAKPPLPSSSCPLVAVAAAAAVVHVISLFSSPRAPSPASLSLAPAGAGPAANSGAMSGGLVGSPWWASREARPQGRQLSGLSPQSSSNNRRRSNGSSSSSSSGGGSSSRAEPARLTWGLAKRGPSAFPPVVAAVAAVVRAMSSPPPLVSLSRRLSHMGRSLPLPLPHLPASPMAGLGLLLWGGANATQTELGKQLPEREPELSFLQKSEPPIAKKSSLARDHHPPHPQQKQQNTAELSVSRGAELGVSSPPALRFNRSEKSEIVDIRRFRFALWELPSVGSESTYFWSNKSLSRAGRPVFM